MSDAKETNGAKKRKHTAQIQTGASGLPEEIFAFLRYCYNPEQRQITNWLITHPSLGLALTKFKAKISTARYEDAFNIAVSLLQSIKYSTDEGLLEYIYASLALYEQFKKPYINESLTNVTSFSEHFKLLELLYKLYMSTQGQGIFDEESILKNKDELRKHINMFVSRLLGNSSVPGSMEAKATSNASGVANYKRDIIEHLYGQGEQETSVFTWVLEAAVNYSAQSEKKQQEASLQSSVNGFQKLGIPNNEVKATLEWIEENWQAVRKGMVSEKKDLNVEGVHNFVQQALSYYTGVDIAAPSSSCKG